jgi:hypothetical protein
MSLSSAATNENLCASCHNIAGAAGNFPLESMIPADLNARTGSSHLWNAPAVVAAAGATTPANANMVLRLDAGKVICSTCHDQHRNLTAAVAAGTAGTQHQSPVTKLAGAGTGVVSYAATADAAARSYLTEIVEVAGASGTARFRLSTDGGISWFGYSGGWVTYATGNAVVTGSSIQLTDGTRVLATFTGTFALGDRHRFYVGYPFLRAGTDTGDNSTGARFCRDCHSDMAMDHSAVRTWDGLPKSHPVGVTLGVNGGGYDRSVPLDANGAAQGGAGVDANATNDLHLASDSTVQCLTCHGVHHADGNSASVDTP